MFLFEEGRFYQLNQEDKMIAEVTYQTKGHVFYLDHTFVDPSLRGQGIARKLVDEVVSLARSKGYKVKPVCPYALKLFIEDPSYGDVWDK